MSDIGAADVGVIGLAVMGQNLALNIADHGFVTAVYNRTTSVTDTMLAEHPDGSLGAGYRGRGPGRLVGAESLEAFVASLKRPRVAVLLIKAGRPTDAVIDQLAPLLEKGDVIVDGGNAHWADTERRLEALEAKGIHFVGSGVSGGELGARFGPSLMPGGSREGWASLQPVWEAIAAKVDAKTGKPIPEGTAGAPADAPHAETCTAWIGPGASGHFVKMVHNGIEYADMQLIAEAYQMLRDGLGVSAPELAPVFASWNQGPLDSFLIEITADVLGQRDPVTGEPFVDVVLDAAGQKGTGAWTGIAALEAGVPAPSIAEAVFARSLSAIKEERVAAAEVLSGPTLATIDDQAAFVDDMRTALLCSKICAYAQGFALMGARSAEKGWELDFATIAQIWRGGCIIRARLLQEITLAYRADPKLANLMVASSFAQVLRDGQQAWRRVVARACERGTPVPAMASALAYFDGYRSARVSANLIQAQRDYFGAHTYERVDQPRGRHFHLDWPEDGRPQVEA